MITIPFSDIAGCRQAHSNYYENDDQDDRPLSSEQKRKMMIEEQMEMDMAFEIADMSF